MLFKIRPHKVLDLLERSERISNIYIHPNAPMALEVIIQISLLKYIHPEIYFEFGTYRGINALNVAMNSEEWGGKVFTLDLDKESFLKADISDFDYDIASTHIGMEGNLAFENTKFSNQVTKLYGDSTKIDLSKYYKKIPFVYVDGGHNYYTVSSDTTNALKMLPNNGESCLVWHDYNSKVFEDVTRCVDKTSSELDIFWVEETMTAFHVKNIKKNTRKMLLSEPIKSRKKHRV